MFQGNTVRTDAFGLHAGTLRGEHLEACQSHLGVPARLGGAGRARAQSQRAIVWDGGSRRHIRLTPQSVQRNQPLSGTGAEVACWSTRSFRAAQSLHLKTCKEFCLFILAAFLTCGSRASGLGVEVYGWCCRSTGTTSEILDSGILQSVVESAKIMADRTKSWSAAACRTGLPSGVKHVCHSVPPTWDPPQMVTPPPRPARGGMLVWILVPSFSHIGN